jgi:hypothetical protein
MMIVRLPKHIHYTLLYRSGKLEVALTRLWALRPRVSPPPAPDVYPPPPPSAGTVLDN